MAEVRSKIGSPGLGVSADGSISRAVTAAAAQSRNGRLPHGLVPGCCRPRPWDRSRSPRGHHRRSEIINVSTCPGAAPSASRPHLMADRCLRAVLISSMLALHRRRARLTTCLSASVTPSAGSQQKRGTAQHQAERQIMAVRPRTISIVRAAARWRRAALLARLSPSPLPRWGAGIVTTPSRRHNRACDRCIQHFEVV
jgi:hypothetical protein